MKASEELSGRYIVHSYNSCDAYYNGKHSEGVVLNSCQFGCGRGCGQVELLENPNHNLSLSITFGENGYFSSACAVESCSVCQTKTIDETIAAIFEWRGYSVSTYGETRSITQGFGINREALEAYKVYVPSFDFGIFATVNKTGGEYAPSLDDADVVVVKFDRSANDLIDVKVTGIPLDKTDALIVLCAYATEEGNVYYLDGGKTGETVTGVSYNDIVNN